MSFSKYRKTPFALVRQPNGEVEQVNGSDEVIDHLESLAGRGKPDAEVQKWRDWVNAWVVHLLPPNIYLTPQESLQAFDYISRMSNFSWVERVSAKYAGALAMYFVAKRAHDKYGVSKDDPRGDLYRATKKWGEEALSNGSRPFHGGSEPDLADLSMYGVMRSIVGNYQTWTDVQANGDARFLSWFARMDALVKAKRESAVARHARAVADEVKSRSS